ncbi:MAG: hypothetical protein OQL06_15210 [Gammaproteobacteria bacterium]|nr:hypothetical protein [Gammaproteobacteria bacterium]
MHRPLAIFLGLFCLGLLQSCGMIPKLHELPATDIMYIHNNPKAGDYAIYEIDNGRVRKRYEVVDVNSGKIVIRYGVIYETTPSHWFYRKLNTQGKVLSAWMIENGQRFDTPVAKPGQINSLERFTQIKPVFDKPVITRAGSFKINQACNYIYRLDMGLASSNSTHFDMLSDQVPFRLVRGEIIATAETGGFIKTLEFISAAGDAALTKSYSNLYRQLNPNSTVQHIRNELIEYGNSNRN